MLGRVLCRSVFLLAALSAIAATSGVGVPPHRELPGTPLYHAHVLGAYRFGFLLPPLDAAVNAAMAKLHAVLARAGVPADAIARMPGMNATDLPALPTIRSAGLSPVQDLAIVLAVLAILVPRLPRPTLRPAWALALPRIVPGLWTPRPVRAPPRGALLSA